MMLTAYMDDSDMGFEGPAAVFAGWMAPAHVWESFSQDWKREVLDYPTPTVAAFKPNTYTLRGETEQTRLAASMRVLGKHKIIGILTIVDNAMYKRVISGANVPTSAAKTPYYFAVHTSVSLVSRLMSETNRQSGVETGPVQFVFDVQPGQEEFVRNSWPNMLNYIEQASPNLRPLLTKTPPLFMHDEDALPLQAAHMLAWSYRRLAHDVCRSVEPFQLGWPAHIKIMHEAWTIEEKLRSILPPT
jgi:hypothetical protein